MAFQVPPLPSGYSIVDEKGRPSSAFQIWWQKLKTSLEAQEAAQTALLTQIADILGLTADLDAAVTAAQAAADTAIAAAADSNSVASLTNSGVTGATITATDAGANVTVTISAHTRVYGDGTSVAVNAGSVLGLAYTTDYFIYYDDPARAGGAVTYAATTSETTAAQTGDRHLVGMVTTPAAAAPPEIGDNVKVPGVGGIQP